MPPPTTHRSENPSNESLYHRGQMVDAVYTARIQLGIQPNHVVCTTGIGTRLADEQYAVASAMLKDLVHREGEGQSKPGDIEAMIATDLQLYREEVDAATRPKNNVEHFEWAANTLTRAIGTSDVQVMHNMGWESLTVTIHRVMPPGKLEVHFSNTWGGDDGYASYYRVYVNSDRGSDVYDDWANEVVFKRAAVNECAVDCHREEFLGFVLEALGAINTALNTMDPPFQQSTGKRLAHADTDLSKVREQLNDILSADAWSKRERQRVTRIKKELNLDE